MTALATKYPYRQALSYALRALILQTAVPSLNLDLTSQMTASAGRKIPQFSEATIVVGDMMNIAEPTICIVDAGEEDGWIGAGAGGLMSIEMATQIRIKTLYAADNDPEDYALFFTIAVDTLRDLFNQQANYNIHPSNPVSGAPLLLGGATFKSCRMTGARPMTFPVGADADSVTRSRGWLITHLAKIEYPISRQYALGQ